MDNFNTLIKVYAGGHIFHFGTAYIIIFARHNENGFYSEYYLLVEKPDGSFDHMAQCIKSKLTEKELENIEDFITEICLRDIKSYIAKVTFENSQQNGTELNVPVGEITLNEMKISFMLLYLLHKDKNIIEWILATTKAPELKNKINMYKDFVVQITSLS